MNDMTRFEHSLPQTAVSIRQHVNLVQEVMQAVMKKDVHYGVIPGTQKPSLWKPGAEVLCMTFRIAPSFLEKDLSTDDCHRYRVFCKGTHQTSGILMGEGFGECSSNEEKYKWRKASSNREFDATPVDRKRVKYGWDKQAKKEYEIRQVRTEPADVANTILKMAGKRAHIAMTLNVLAASDIFTQDIEDLPPELQGDDEQAAAKKETGVQAYPDEGFQKNLPTWRKLIESGTKTADQIIATVESKGTLTDAQKDAIRGPKPTSTEPTQQPGAGAPPITFAIVMDKLQKTNELDLLDAHADLIAQVADKDQRDELTEYYKNRRAQLEGGGK